MLLGGVMEPLESPVLLEEAHHHGRAWKVYIIALLLGPLSVSHYIGEDVIFLLQLPAAMPSLPLFSPSP